MKIGDYKIKLTIKSMCLFEQLTGKSFLRMTDDDVVDIIYAMFVTTNNLRITKEAFCIMLQDSKVAKWMMTEYEKQANYDKQLKFFNQDTADVNGTTGEVVTMSISELAGELISHGMDPHYVMYDMELWEAQMYRNAIEQESRTRLEEGRLWTWLSILPHLDKKASSKLKKPSDLLPFPWDKEVKDKREAELENNTKAALSFFAAQAKKNDEDAT